jgi:hypothetical protein
MTTLIKGGNADTVDGYHASTTATASTIPVAGDDGKLSGDWFSSISHTINTTSPLKGGGSFSTTALTLSLAGLETTGLANQFVGVSADYRYWEYKSLIAGTGIILSHNPASLTITNSSPDQVVSLTGGTGISVSGTYPSFTISASVSSYWTDATTYIYPSTTSNVFKIADTATSESLIGQGTSTNIANWIKPIAVSGRNYSLAVELDANTSESGDKLALYCATKARSTFTGTVWALNSLIELDSGFAGTATCFEVDVNNNTSSDNKGNGISITGISSSGKSAGAAIVVARVDSSLWENGVFLMDVKTGFYANQDDSTTNNILQLQHNSNDKFYITYDGNAFVDGYLYLDDISAPSPTTNKLYSVSGGLYWNGTAIGGSSSVAFHANRGGSSQTISDDTWTLIEFGTEVFDTASCYDTGTYKFTPNVAGKYLITVQTSMAYGSVDNWCTGAGIWKNGTQVQSGIYWFAKPTSSSNGRPYATCTAVLDMNGSTDYVQGYCYHAFAGVGDLSLDGSTIKTFFCGAKIG